MEPINKNIIEGKWNEIKGEILRAWGKLTDDEIDRSKGNIEALTGIIQQRYGEQEQKISEKMKHILSRFNDKAEDIKNNLKQH